MTGGAINRGQQNFNTDIQTRVDALTQSGVAISDPVQTFSAAPSVAAQGGTVTFQVYQTQGIDRIEILRNTNRDYGSAAVLQSYPASQMKLNRPIQTTDATPAASASTLYYWLRAIPTSGKFPPIYHGPFTVTVP